MKNVLTKQHKHTHSLSTGKTIPYTTCINSILANKLWENSTKNSFWEGKGFSLLLEILREYNLK